MFFTGHQHWSSEQPHLPGDLSPNLSELHVTEAARDCGRERRIEVGRSVSEEVMGSHHKDSERGTCTCTYLLLQYHVPV